MLLLLFFNFFVDKVEKAINNVCETFGHIYKAKDDLDREVILKYFDMSLEKQMEFYVDREIKIGLDERIKCSYLINFKDFFYYDNHRIVIMDLVEQTLESVLLPSIINSKYLDKVNGEVFFIFETIYLM
jgi:hypothetical protein